MEFYEESKHAHHAPTLRAVQQLNTERQTACSTGLLTRLTATETNSHKHEPNISICTRLKFTGVNITDKIICRSMKGSLS